VDDVLVNSTALKLQSLCACVRLHACLNVGSSEWQLAPHKDQRQVWIMWYVPSTGILFYWWSEWCV